MVQNEVQSHSDLNRVLGKPIQFAKAADPNDSIRKNTAIVAVRVMGSLNKGYVHVQAVKDQNTQQWVNQASLRLDGRSKHIPLKLNLKPDGWSHSS